MEVTGARGQPSQKTPSVLVILRGARAAKALLVGWAVSVMSLALAGDSEVRVAMAGKGAGPHLSTLPLLEAPQMRPVTEV
jgi:hypothetical protein